MGKLNIITGKRSGALKVVLYGPEGIGKSTLASRFPRPLFIDTEGSTRHMDVARTERPASWAQLLDQVSCVWADPGLCETLVIDTADWAEQLCITEFCANKKLTGIEEMGYGKGYVYIAEDFGRLLNTLSEITERGIHVVLTAHAQMRKFEQPDEMGAYDRWELKLQKKTAALVKEWADLLLFANYKTISVAADKEGKKFKAQGGRRVLYTTHHPCWDAKNRLGLPEELPMEWEALAPYLPARSGGETGDGRQVAAPTKPPTVESVGADIIRPSDANAGAAEEMTCTGVQAPQGPSGVPGSRETGDGDITHTAGNGNAQGAGDAGPVPSVLAPLLESAGVTEAEVREVIAKRQGSFPLGTTWQVMEDCGFVQGWVLPYWKNIVQMIEENPERLPFTV